MKRFIFTVGIVIFGLFSCAFLAQADDDSNISWEEKHKDQPAVYLLSEVTIEVRDDWSYKVKEHYKAKIQKEEAKSMGEIPIRYNKSRQKVTNIRAYTTTPDGKKHRYSKIQDFKAYKGYPMYSDYRMKVITMPEVRMGSIVEYEKTTITRRLPIKRAFWFMTSLDTGEPVKEDKFTIILPKKLSIKYKEFNLKYKPIIKDDGERIIYSWHLTDLESRDSEEFLPPPDLDNIGNCVEFSSIESWQDISKWYHGLIKKNTVINSQIENKVKELVKDKKTVKDKIRAILEYVQDDFRYVSMSLGSHTLEPHPTDEVFKNKYGDCKDLSLLCMCMFKIAGIDSNMTLFNNEFSITDPRYDLPLPTIFDHVLLEVEDESGNFYIDPLLDGYDIEEYPLSYQAAYTFVITESGGRFGRFPVFDEKRNYTKMDSMIEIKEDGSAIIEKKSLWDLDFSIKTRDVWKAMTQKKRDKFLQILDTSVVSDGKMIKRHWENMEGKYGCVEGFIKYEKPHAYPITDGMIIVNPGGYSRDSDFAKEKRRNPIFFPGNSLEEESATYILPKEFKLTHVPENLDLDIGFFGFKRNYEVEEGRLVIKEIARWTRKEIPVERYNEVRDFFNELPHKTYQRIILKKIAKQ